MKATLLTLATIGSLLAPCAPKLGAQTLTQALDTTGLTWTSGGTGNIQWLGQTSQTYDGVDAAQSGTITGNQESWIETTVTGPGTLTFWWRVTSELGGDFLGFYRDTTLLASISGEVDWQFKSFSIPAGTQILKWRYAKNVSGNYAPDKGWVDQVIYVTTPPIALQDALNTCGVKWNSGGNTNPTSWAGQTNVTHDGKSATESGAVYNNQETWTQAVVSGVTNVSFWWKVSSETDYDWLEFHTNGVLAKRVSGEVNWQSNFFKLPTTTNTLTWRYVKDDIQTLGQDRGWVDQVAFNPPLRALPYGLADFKRLSDGRFQFAVTGEVGCACSVQFSTNLQNWSPLSNFTTTSASQQIIDNGASNSVARYYRTLSP